MLFNILFTVTLGSLLHFAFDFFNYSFFVGLFSAINESAWEHLKLAVTPMVILSFWQGVRLKKKPNNFWLSRVKAIYLAPIMIVILFYGYTAILGNNYLVLDIAVFVISVIIAEVAASRIQRMPRFPIKCEATSKIMILFIVVLFAYFTAYPPHNFLFHDPITNSYGFRFNSVCTAGNCDEGISLPQGYSLDTYSIEKTLDVPCTKNSDCETPMEYLIQSRCPFVSICLKHKCAVICPAHQ